MQNENVLNPVATVQFRGGIVEVREMRWGDYLHVVKQMTSTAFTLFAGGKINPGELTLDKDVLLKAISSQEELFAWVIEKATNLPKETIPELTATEAIRLLEKIVEMNLRPELVTSGKALAGRMGDIFQVKSPLGAPSIASSSPATRLGT